MDEKLNDVYSLAFDEDGLTEEDKQELKTDLQVITNKGIEPLMESSAVKKIEQDANTLKEAMTDGKISPGELKNLSTAAKESSYGKQGIRSYVEGEMHTMQKIRDPVTGKYSTESADHDGIDPEELNKLEKLPKEYQRQMNKTALEQGKKKYADRFTDKIMEDSRIDADEREKSIHLTRYI